MESVARDTAVHSAVYKYSNSIDIEFVSCTYRLILLGSQQPPLAAFAICFLSTTRARTLKLTTTQTFHDTRSATLSLMVGTTFGDMVLDNHISDGLGAESNMHAESAIGFSTRSIPRTQPTAFQQGCIFDTQPLEKMAQRQLEDLISQRFTESIGLRDQNDCRTAKVVLQNHDVCPLGFPHVFLTTVRLPAALLTGPCL
jgi:hypothetical protein